MGYLNLSSGTANFSKAVISCWFRVPAATLAAARAQFDAAMAIYPDTDFNLVGIVPIVTFGPNNETYTIYDSVPAAISTGPMCTSVIGIATGNTGPSFDYANTMYARFQYSTGAPAPTAGGVYNEFFQVGSQLSASRVSTPGDLSGNAILVSAETWHHILVSFDFSGGCSSHESTVCVIDTTCPFYWAFDDVNYNSSYLWPNTPAMLTDSSFTSHLTDVPQGIFSDGCIINAGSYSFAAGNLPTIGNPIGLPSHSVNVSKIYDVEMAALQFFTGVTLDTSLEETRRLFVTADGRPADQTLAAAALGVTPIIRFDKQTDWTAGRNRGSGGNLAKTGTITAYSPDPAFGA